MLLSLTTFLASSSLPYRDFLQLKAASAFCLIALDWLFFCEFSKSFSNPFTQIASTGVSGDELQTFPACCVKEHFLFFDLYLQSDHYMLCSTELFLWEIRDNCSLLAFSMLLMVLRLLSLLNCLSSKLKSLHFLKLLSYCTGFCMELIFFISAHMTVYFRYVTEKSVNTPHFSCCWKKLAGKTSRCPDSEVPVHADKRESKCRLDQQEQSWLFMSERETEIVSATLFLN